MFKNRKFLTALVAVAAMCLIAVASSAFVAPFVGAYAPSNTTTASSHLQLRTASPAFANFVIDRPMFYIPVAPVQISTTDGLVSVGGGAGTYTEVGTSESVAVFVDTDNDTVGSGIVPLPMDIDLAKDIQCRVIWHQSQAAGTGTIDWVLTYEVYKGGTTQITVPNDAFDVNGGAQADLAADVLTLGPWSTITGGTISATPGDDFFALLAKYDETTCTDAEIDGFQCRYYRKWLGGGLL